MEVCVLASGSSGNCFYIQNHKSGILIDAGISAKQIVQRLSNLKINPEGIGGIFVTHEHSDHTSGVDVFARMFGVPVFATKKTAKSCFLCSDKELINFIKNDEIVDIGGMKVGAFSKSHKCVDPVSYSITKEKKISIITDAGHGCQNIIDNVSGSDFLCIESNYDDWMLENGPYPYFLKKWIKSDNGHLSNLQSALCVLEHARPKLKNVVLSHISKNNNTYDLALKTFVSLIKERKDLSPKVFVSERERETCLFRV